MPGKKFKIKKYLIISIIGSIILTDQWKPYLSIENMGRRYAHKTVNHSKEFVRKEDKNVHTQNIECLWQKLKRRHKTEFGTAETFELYK